MKREAVDKARARLRRAKVAAELLKSPAPLEGVEDAWTDFLLASNAVYTALEQGAKDNPRTRQWFGGKKRERRDDPLLQYLHAARNADEHGLEKIHEPVVTKLKRVPILERVDWVDGVEVSRVKNPPPQGPDLFTLNFQTVEVVDTRYDTKFAPPTEHLGKPIERNSPRLFAELAIAYQEALIEEAASMT